MLLSTKHLKLKGVGNKLKPKFVGPYKVLKQVGSNAFKLEIPLAMGVHPVFNVSLLKKYLGSLARPAPIEIDGEAEYEIEALVGHCR